MYVREDWDAMGDLICVHDEVLDPEKPMELFDPVDTWKRKIFENYTLRELQVPVFKDGQCVYQSPSAPEIRTYCQAQLDTLWEEVKRFENPHTYYVDLSEKLWNIKQELLAKKGRL